MLGISYDNHPRLKHILMPESWIGWPLRTTFLPYSAYACKQAKKPRKKTETAEENERCWRYHRRTRTVVDVMYRQNYSVVTWRE
ncbi:NADH:ubiquinone oxidoreductase, 30kDa subunit, partial [Cynara cardunculus var. scolymus]